MLPDGYREPNRVSLRVRLESAGWRWAFALIILLLFAGLCWQVTRAWIAAEYAASAKPELRRRATQLEPDNAAYWAQLGSMEVWDLERGDLEHAATDYERAVQANPYSDRDWLELAGIYERRGQISRARAAYERAQFDYPMSPTVAWLYGNFLLRQANAAQACIQFRNALARDPDLAQEAVALWWNSGLHNSQPIGNLLPPEDHYYFKAMDYLARQKEFDTGLGVWNELLRLGRHFQLPQALRFIDELISAGRVTDAQRLWRQAIDVSEWPRKAQDGASLVFNGGFEHDFANGGFDWREQETADASFALDTEIRNSGMRSLRVSFKGKSNLDFHHIFQYVPVEPGHRYRFVAYLKSSSLSTDSGIRFLIEDPLRPSMPQILTKGVTGTLPWTRIETEFSAGPDTRLASIVLRRTPSLKFDNKLGGAVWVDDVSLVERTSDGNEKGASPITARPSCYRIFTLTRTLPLDCVPERSLAPAARALCVERVKSGRERCVA